jgi:hypothetical protein
MTTRESQNERRVTGILKRWFVFVFALAMVGCASNQVAQRKPQKGLVKTPVAPDSSAIVVIPNPYVDNLAQANQAAEEAKQELINRGYKVVSSEAEADLVAIPTVETNTSVRLITAVRPVDLVETPAPGDAQVDRTATVANSLGSLGSLSFRSSSGSSSGSGNGRPLLVIEAFRKDAWDKALIVNELQLPPVWKVQVPLPASLKPTNEGGAIAGRGDTDFVLPR